jgi:hypothetical protein
MSVRDPVFRPIQGSTKTITTVANTSVSANWTGDAFNSAAAETLEVCNTTVSTVFVRTGIGATTASAADYPVPANATRRFAVHILDDTAAVFLPTAGTVGAVYVTRGHGGTSA